MTHPRSTPGRNWDSVPIDRNWVIQRILELPGEIEEAEYGVIVATIDVENAKTALKDKEAALFNEGKVEGKNDAQRKACLLSLTVTERADITADEESLANCRLAYNRKLNDFAALKAVAHLIPVEVS